MSGKDIGYKSYFVFYVKNYGWPKITRQGLDDYFDVIELESKISGLQVADPLHREIYMNRKKLLSITKRKKPDDFLKSLLSSRRTKNP